MTDTSQASTMFTKPSARLVRRIATAFLLASFAIAALPAPTTLHQASSDGRGVAVLSHLSDEIQVGDLVFTRIDVKPFREVAASTASWTNHVGIVIGRNDEGPIVAESTFPLSRTTPLADFIRRSQDGRVAIMRMTVALDTQTQARLNASAMKRTGIFYDTGFNLHSRRQFCSRFVHEVIAEATGVQVGDVQTLAQLFGQNPQASLGFWRLWYLGSIPWARETITPASMLASPRLKAVFDGRLVSNSL